MNTIYTALGMMSGTSFDGIDLWKPDLTCFVDSEIWPNFLFKIKEKFLLSL